MKRAGVLLFLAGAAMGFLAAAFFGHDPAAIRGGRGGGGEAGARALSPAAARAPAEALEEARGAAARLAEENEILRRRIEEVEQDPPAATAGGAASPARGTRLPDGRIVGGAKLPDTMLQAMLSYLENELRNFLKEARLTPTQEARVRELYDQSLRGVVQGIVDVINGDLEPDAAYAAYAALAQEGFGRLREVLDGEQYAVFERFEKGMRDWNLGNVVSGDMQMLRSRLELDSEQEKLIAPLVRERYDRVQAQIPFPIPNLLFRPIRRNQDRLIYEESAQKIRTLLRPDQAALFDAIESDPHADLQRFRSQLVPR
ncbi:MAG: hypothetical protein ACT4PV_09550 [Planctomycetaceae bacterium]